MIFRATTMGMPLAIHVLGPRATRAACAAAYAYLDEMDRTFSTYKADSDISRLNTGQIRRDEAPAPVREVLAACERLTAVTDGYFDIRTPWGVDPSGYVKGYAVYHAAMILEAHGIDRYLIDLAGDMQIKGAGPRGRLWRVGITHPHDPALLAKRLYLTDCAIATSGTTERGLHIYDPHTGRPAADALSLTVIGDTIDRVDAFATAAFAMGRPGLAWLGLQGYEGCLITPDDRLTMTEGFVRFERPDRLAGSA